MMARSRKVLAIVPCTVVTVLRVLAVNLVVPGEDVLRKGGIAGSHSRISSDRSDPSLT